MVNSLRRLKKSDAPQTRIHHSAELWSHFCLFLFSFVKSFSLSLSESKRGRVSNKAKPKHLRNDEPNCSYFLLCLRREASLFCANNVYFFRIIKSAPNMWQFAFIHFDAKSVFKGKQFNPVLVPSLSSGFKICLFSIDLLVINFFYALKVIIKIKFYI